MVCACTVEGNRGSGGRAGGCHKSKDAVVACLLFHSENFPPIESVYDGKKCDTSG
jgi:hypothetical protein